MSSVQRPDSFDLADYTGVLRRRWPIVLIITILGVIGAFGYIAVSPKSYTATT
jgi:uncharacterized protein involved in exopolysaccharide biosynthesis